MSIDNTKNYLGQTLGPGKQLEMIVASMHGQAGDKLAVAWSEEIDGRQFDVTLRFREGMHDYLTVIECKDYSERVSVDRVEAFVTKSNGVNANKAVMISVNGFQSGAITVAKKHGIKLLTVTEEFIDAKPIEIESRVPGMSIFDLRIYTTDGTADVCPPDDDPRFTYFWKHAKLHTEFASGVFEEIVVGRRPDIFTTIPESEESVEIEFQGGASLEIPWEKTVGISRVSFKRKKVDFVVPKGKPSIEDRYCVSEPR
jgi:Restriction endonuclease